MLVAEKSQGQAAPRAGEQVGIHFTLPGERGDQHYRQNGSIVRVMQSGIGISFPESMDEACMDALLEYSNRSDSQPTPPVAEPQGAPAASDAASVQTTEETTTPQTTAEPEISIDPEGARRIIAACRGEVTEVVAEMNDDFFDHMDNELLSLARSAGTNAEQSVFFATMTTLENAKDTVGQKFVTEVLDQIDNPQELETILAKRREREDRQRDQQDSGRIRLSLVNADEFEDWLTVANIIERTERMYTKYLEEMQTRLGLIVSAWSHNEVNPFGPAVFAKAFDDAIRDVDLSRDVRQKVYDAFEVTVPPLFRRLYISITELMEESGLFPDIDEAYVTAAARKAAEQQRAKLEEGQVSAAEEQSQSPTEQVDEEPATQVGQEPAGQAGQRPAGQAGQRPAGQVGQGSAGQVGQGSPEQIGQERSDSTGQPQELTGQEDTTAEEEQPQAAPAQRRRRRAERPGGTTARSREAVARRRETAARRREAGARSNRMSGTRQTLKNLYNTVKTLTKQLGDDFAEEEDVQEENLYRLDDIRDALSTMQLEQLEAPTSGQRKSVHKA
jgi:hypothetical protein|tara:strand:+ start:2162 stop:3838 length:1677 start_codon:yes stop_codon:yes gene_type:complete